MICILEVHDTTGKDSTSDLNSAVNYWLEMKDLLNANKDYVILNIANEWCGQWDKDVTSDSDKALWKNTYVQAVQALRNYGICVGIEVLIAFLVIWSKGFFTDRASVNVQILADAFFVSGILMTLFAGMMYVSGEGALIGIGFVLRNAVLTFIPMGRAKQERYADYRARKLGAAKKSNNRYVLVTGLIFLFIGILLTVIWYVNFYNA